MATTNSNTHITTHTELSIQISLSGLSFCILNANTKQVDVLKHIRFNKHETPYQLLEHVQALFKNETCLQQDFSNVQIIHTNELSTLVPKPLFNEDCLADYLKYNSKILKSDFITCDDIDINDSVNVYVPYVNVNNFIYEHFGAFTYKHFSTVLIESILQIEKNADQPKLYIHMGARNFEIISVVNRELQFYNTFEYSSKEDFIYYLLFTVEQLKLNPETIQLVFVGDILEHSDIYNIAYKYVRHISFGSNKHNYTFNQQPETPHAEFVILNSF
ncbi:DUF3822 family protein [Formosa algae]|uniref:DUF3822 domain-containing protein n=1 Tax=Formosa algae TaxID=225843 RepID=A0A9X0YLJ8_9FLAO|nr:DUF3822 family protein [Formosa algae]MBP1840849.1 hypothetical protein [Formosa algae]MDQ0336254.1 hypothetical protein [Formosa algae]OEI80025.1 hypothetical protein AST99_12140 [Formosa algae]